MPQRLIALASLVFMTLTGSLHAEEAVQAQPVHELTVEQALGNGPYRVLTPDDIKRLAKPISMRVKTPEGIDFVTWRDSLRLSIALNLMAKDGWELLTLKPAYTENLGGPHKVRIRHGTLYIFRRTAPIDIPNKAASRDGDPPLR